MKVLLDTLADVGFRAITADFPAPPHDDDDIPNDGSFSPAEHSYVRSKLLEWETTDRKGKNGCFWGTRAITWPDRVPALKTWAGNATLKTIIDKHVARLAESACENVLLAEGKIRTSKGEGASGFDWLTSLDAIDVGFSLKQVGMDILCRPGRELLAIYGLDTLTLISNGPRDAGFILDGLMYPIKVEDRTGGYFFRWPYFAQPVDIPVEYA